MLFSSPLFLFIFFPAFFLLFLLSGRHYRNYFLLLGSLLFYFWGEPLFSFIAILSALIDYVLCQRIAHHGKETVLAKRYLILGIVLNLFLLFYYKYRHFFLSALLPWFTHATYPLLDILLPIGISFIVFEKITYLVDVYRGRGKVASSLLHYLNYVFLFPIFFRHNLIWIIIILCLLPGLFGLVAIVCGEHAVPKILRADYRLAGVTTAEKEIPFDYKNFSTHRSQQRVETWLSSHLPLRSLFIRLNNQVYYSLFKKSYAENGQLIVGKNKQLFVYSYIRAYCQPNSQEIMLRAWADKLKMMNDFFRHQHKMFVYVMTPSKAEYQRQSIPDRYHCQTNGISPQVLRLAQLLDERHVPYINGSLLLQKAHQYYSLALFPKGGIHWNKLGASITANAITNTLNQQAHVNLKALQFHYHISHEPKGSDSDVISLLNLLRPQKNYAVPKLIFIPTPPKKPLHMAMIGGSFCSLLIEAFIESKTMDKISFYRYLKLDKRVFTYPKKEKQFLVAADDKKILSDILTADIVLLEENAETTVSPHGEAFYQVIKRA